MTGFLQALGREIRLTRMCLPSSLAWSLAIGLLFVLIFEVQS